MNYRAHLLAAVLLAAGAAAHAAPFAISYHGTVGPPDIGTSAIPGINAGEPYSITYIVDNQGSSASSQTWTASHLTCALLRFNTGATARLTVDLVAMPPDVVQAQLQTGSAGTVTEMFQTIAVGPIQAGQFSATGVSLQPPLALETVRHSPVLNDGAAPSRRSVTDAADGVNMTPSGWSSPVAVTGACDDTPLAPLPPPPGTPTGVTAQPGNGQVTVSWQPPAGSTPPLSYTVHTYDGSIPRSCTVHHPATSCTVMGLANDQPYTFVVTAAAPRSRPSAPSNPVTAAPGNNPGPGPGPGPRPGGVQAVPALGLPALALLGTGAAGLGALRLRRRS